MARSRNIKPGFFVNPEVVELPFETRLLFIGLWTLADRDGRLEDRPKKIKMAIFPADNLEIDPMLDQLDKVNLIHRYEAGSVHLIEIPKFSQHQSPHHKEPSCNFPAYPGQVSDKSRTSRSDCLNLIPDSLSNGQQVDRFPEFWTVYPEKKKKKTAREIWKRKRLDDKADVLIADVRARMERDGQWNDGFIPHPTTYLNQERWEDDFTPIKEKKSEQLFRLTDNQLIEKAKGKNIGTQGKSRDQLIAALEAQ